jgi:hypothetical protein
MCTEVEGCSKLDGTSEFDGSSEVDGLAGRMPIAGMDSSRNGRLQESTRQVLSFFECSDKQNWWYVCLHSNGTKL